MAKLERLRKNYQFIRVYKRGRFFKGKYLILYILTNGVTTSRVGISISRKFGSSVRRNKMKRFIRECYQSYQDEVTTGYDLVFVVRNGIKNDVPSYHVVKKEVKDLLGKVGKGRIS